MLYCIVDANQQPIYVGRTKRPDCRLIEHTKRFGSQIQMLDLDDDDENEQYWINYFRFMGANLSNVWFKHSPIFDYAKDRPVTNNVKVIITMLSEKTDLLRKQAELHGISLPMYCRMILGKQAVTNAQK